MNPVDAFTLKEVFASMASPHVILMFLVYFMGGTNIYGLALFLPSIVNSLGFSPNKSQLLSVGPFAIGFFGTLSICTAFLRHYPYEICLVTMILAYLSDRYKTRAIPLISVSLLSVAGYSTYLGSFSCPYHIYQPEKLVLK